MNKLNKKRKTLFLCASFIFIIFIIFTYFVKKDLLTKYDFNTTVIIQDRIPKGADNFLSFFSIFGGFEVQILILLIFLLIRKKPIGIFVILFYFFAHLLELLGKILMNHPGPPFVFFRFDFPILFPSHYVQAFSSYPSGHSLRAVFGVIVIGYILNNKLKIKNKKLFYVTFFIYVAIMLVSRVSLGEHWASDVIGGSLLGLSFGLFSLIFLL
jgi:membrane-associated phospholipid phosphatase